MAFDQGYADALAEIETLRQEAKEADRKLAISEAACASAMAEVEALRADLARWTSGQRRKGLPIVDAVPDGIQYAAQLARSIGTEGGEEHDRLLSEASQRMKALHDAAAYLIAERDRIRTAAQHVVDVYRQGNVMGTHVAVDRLGEVLDGGT